MPDHLIKPHGGTLANLLVSEEKQERIKTESRDLPSWDLTPRQLCDLELLVNGAFSPLRGFMGKADFDSVSEKMELADGTLWPLPILLDVSEELAGTLATGKKLSLRDPEGVLLAVLHVDETFPIDRDALAQAVYGTTDQAHPAVAYINQQMHPVAVAGRIEAVAKPAHYDFVRLRHTPAELRNLFAKRGWRRVVAFQTRNPMHRAHFELTLRAAKEVEANLLVHPVVGMTKPGDVDHYTRVRCYQALIGRFPKQTVALSLLPLAMRMGGPREALLHAIIRKNYGCTHLIVGRDHAGPGKDSKGEPFYGPYDAQEMMKSNQERLGITMVPFRMMVYVPTKDSYMPLDEVKEGTQTLSISGTELRERLSTGRDIPEWFTFPEVARELRRTYQPRSKQGFTVFFTGLSGSGKSTVANVLLVKFLEAGGRPVTLLDGDIVRKNLSSELGFSKAHRDLNIQRIGFVASEITKNGGIAICAPIAPYDAVRKQVREVVSKGGGFILVHVSTPLETCEKRDRKGLYAKARAGIIKEFTGISDPYEAPDDAEIAIDTTDITPSEAAQRVILHLEREGFIGGNNG